MEQPPRLPEALGEYAGRGAARFHMPGHKGRGMAGFFHGGLMGWDITELSFSDDLHAPCAAIERAQRECAVRYGAAHTFFLVNGATAGLHALLLSLPAPARVLLGRDCHRSAVAGCALAGHTFRFVEPAYAQETGLFGCVTPEALDAALTEAPAEAVLLTSPNYYGLCADIPALARVAHAHGALLFMDAAHGAHFPFSDTLPQSPAGHADAWVHSAHKTLNALGQAALLHIGERISAAAVQRGLAFTETSSPSYLLLASLDWAVYSAAQEDCWTRTAGRCATLGSGIGRLLGLSVLPRSLIGSAGIADMDRTRVAVDVSARGITGFEAQRALEKNNVYVELSDVRRIVCICTPADDPAWYELLLSALQALPYGLCVPPKPPSSYPLAERVLSAGEAIRRPMERVALEHAPGRVAADSAGVYPPGIPLFTPGERIGEDSVAFLLEQRALGAGLFGVHRGTLAVIV